MRTGRFVMVAGGLVAALMIVGFRAGNAQAAPPPPGAGLANPDCPCLALTGEPCPDCLRAAIREQRRLQKRDGSGDAAGQQKRGGDRDRDRKRDGSCAADGSAPAPTAAASPAAASSTVEAGLRKLRQRRNSRQEDGSGGGDTRRKRGGVRQQDRDRDQSCQ